MAKTERRKPASPSATPIRLEQNLCFAIYSASRAFTRAYQPILEPLGLTYPQYLVMLVLWERDQLSVKELGERLGLDSGTLTPLLKRLEETGRVQRKRDARDERVVRIALTPAGRALQDDAHVVPGKLARCAGFTEDEDGLKELGRLRDRVMRLATKLAETRG